MSQSLAPVDPYFAHVIITQHGQCLRVYNDHFHVVCSPGEAAPHECDAVTAGLLALASFRCD